MTSQPALLPSRPDLRSGRTRVAARVMRRGLALIGRVKSLAAVAVTYPDDDPFYRAAEDLDSSDPPGTVVEARRVELRHFRRRVKADAWQVRFRSTDSRGRAVHGIATVMVPRALRGGVGPLLSYQCAIDSLGPAADPSYTLRQGVQVEFPFMAEALRRGWAVVTTDYTGPRHAFAAGLLEARLVLDGIRAAVALEQAGLSATAPIGLWGYSGGAQATVAAAEEQGSYAPELKIVGAAGGGVGADPTSSTRLFRNGSVFSGVALGACIGLSREYVDVDLHGVLTPAGRELVAAAADMTVEELALGFPFLHWPHYLTVPGILEIPGMRNALASIRLGQATPMTAMYLYHGVHDPNMAVADVDALVAKYRAEGVDVTYRRLRFAEHVIPFFAGAPGALRFLNERFALASS